MATRDILTLKTPMAEGIIRLLYGIALILIALGVLAGLGRGVMMLTHAPMQRPAMTSTATPSSGAMMMQQPNASPQTDQGAMRPDFGMGHHGFGGWHRFHHRPFFGMMMHHSRLFGLLVIVGALLRGLIALLIVRVLAEIGLAILTLPKRRTA
jgi:hypothetical protein